jgi:hypothetical protein
MFVWNPEEIVKRMNYAFETDDIVLYLSIVVCFVKGSELTEKTLGNLVMKVPRA